MSGATNLTAAPSITSSSGSGVTAQLECLDLVMGTGPSATPTSTVTVQYVGVLKSDGTTFDSSWARGAASSFPLTGVVPGFAQGIAGAGSITPMRVGGRRMIIIPPALGYGGAATGSIPPNSTLVFVIDLETVTG